MSKQILPNELAEIVTGLLVNPTLLGEDLTPEKHQSFMLAVGEAVAGHFGGQANWVNKADSEEADYLSDEYNCPYLSVSPNEDMPSMNQNVWAAFDTQGWDEEPAEDFGIEVGTPMTDQEVSTLRAQLQSLSANMALNAGEQQTLTHTMVDWQLPIDEDQVPEMDKTVYQSELRIGNQTSLELTDDKGEPVLGMLVEINKGVPALHIDINGGDGLLHIYKAQDGLVLTPGSNFECFEVAEQDRYTEGTNNPLVIRPHS